VNSADVVGYMASFFEDGTELPAYIKAENLLATLVLTFKARF
jgi:hypothetical protein